MIGGKHSSARPYVLFRKTFDHWGLTYYNTSVRRFGIRGQADNVG